MMKSRSTKPEVGESTGTEDTDTLGGNTRQEYETHEAIEVEYPGSSESEVARSSKDDERERMRTKCLTADCHRGFFDGTRVAKGGGGEYPPIFFPTIHNCFL
jgi:hypothetical protein